MNKLIAIFLIVCLPVVSYAQQVPFYNHNLINPFIYNPAMAGYSDNANVYFVRNQRNMGYGTGAINNYLTADGKLFGEKSGFGISAIHQSAGIQQQLGASIAYSYGVNLGKDHTLRLGVSGGFLDNRIDINAIDVAQFDDPYIGGLRPNVASYDLSAGIVYGWKGLRIGVSVPQVIGNKVAYNKDDSRGYFRLARHFMGTVEYDFTLFDNEDLILTPQALVRYVPGAPVQYDFTTQLDYKKLGWLAVGYKSDYAVQFNLGFHILNRVHVGYSYEYIFNSFKSYYTGVNHEFLLGYTFNQKKKPETVTVTLPDPKVVQENEELRRQLAEKENELEQQENDLKEQLRKQLEAHNREKEQLEKELKEKEQKVVEVEKPVERPASPSSPEEKMQKVKGYNFVELDGQDSPDGLYVVIGVFSKKSNADNVLSKVSEEYNDAYLVINQKTGYYYVVLKYSTEKSVVFQTLAKYRSSTGEKVWILDYVKNN